MNATPPAELTPDERRARLDALARREYADLSPDERAEARQNRKRLPAPPEKIDEPPEYG